MPLKTLLALFFTVLAAVFAPHACAGEKPTVFVSVPPQKYFVQRISGDCLDIRVMVDPGASPATYEPRPRQMTALSKTLAYFSVGVPFEEAWLPRFKAAHPHLPVFPTHAGILRVPMEEHLPHEGSGNEHPGRPDPHIWLSPQLVTLQARNILSGLTRVFPEKAPLFRENYRIFLEEIGALDIRLMETFGQDLKRRQFLVFHPSWGYFARDYGLKQAAIETGGKSPRQMDLVKLIQTGREQGWKAIFVQPQFPDKPAKALARDLGAEVIRLDPLAEDWGKNLLEAGRLIRQALD